MEFKKEKRDIISLSPKDTLFYSKPKMGKTTLASHLENAAIIELESGADNLGGYIYDINNLPELDAFIKWAKKENPFDYYVIDTLSRLEEWTTEQATINYMNSPQGVKFNRPTAKDIKEAEKAPKLKAQLEKAKMEGKPYPRNHVKYRSVVELPNGFGYRWTRDCFLEYFHKLRELPGRKIFLAHVKDKMISNKEGEEVTGRDIDLTGKLQSIVPAYVDSIGFLHRNPKDGNSYVSFIKEDSDSADGSRSKHLNDKDILLGEWDNKAKEYSKVHWDKIYID